MCEAAFNGELRKIQLTSSVSLFNVPQTGAEVEQRLTITADGNVWLSRYRFTGNGVEQALADRSRSSIPQESAALIMAAVSRFFSVPHEQPLVKDAGVWELTLTNAEGRAFKASGSMLPDEEANMTGLSDLIRANLHMPDLFLFDGNPDRITKIEVLYHRHTRLKSKAASPGDRPQYGIWDYSESLTMDRDSETMELKRVIGSGCVVTNTYYVQDGIVAFLDSMALDAFSDIIGNPPDAIEDPDNRRDYTIYIHTKYGDTRTVKGSYDKYGLPSDWPEFINDVYEFIDFYGLGEMFSHRLYEKPLRRQSDQIFCNVEFDEGGSTYCYLAESDAFREGDLVIVPVGRNNREAIARIASIEYLPADMAPYPMDKIKKVLRKYSKGEEAEAPRGTDDEQSND